MTTTDEIAAKLREAAQAATPGKWHSARDSVIGHNDDGHVFIADAYGSSFGDPRIEAENNAILIALANPANILALLEERESRQWQPIETASTKATGYFDCACLIGFVAWGKEGRVHTHVGPIVWMLDHWEFMELDYDMFPTPTHWMPFPSPPSLQPQEK